MPLLVKRSADKMNPDNFRHHKAEPFQKFISRQLLQAREAITILLPLASSREDQILRRFV